MSKQAVIVNKNVKSKKLVAKTEQQPPPIKSKQISTTYKLPAHVQRLIQECRTADQRVVEAEYELYNYETKVVLESLRESNKHELFCKLSTSEYVNLINSKRIYSESSSTWRESLRRVEEEFPEIKSRKRIRPDQAVEKKTFNACAAILKKEKVRKTVRVARNFQTRRDSGIVVSPKNEDSSCNEDGKSNSNPSSSRKRKMNADLPSESSSLIEHSITTKFVISKEPELKKTKT